MEIREKQRQKEGKEPRMMGMLGRGFSNLRPTSAQFTYSGDHLVIFGILFWALVG
jgi:hypothetical protein